MLKLMLKLNKLIIKNLFDVVGSRFCDFDCEAVCEAMCETATIFIHIHKSVLVFFIYMIIYLASINQLSIVIKCLLNNRVLKFII